MDEFRKLIEKASAQTKGDVAIWFSYNGKWSAEKNGPESEDIEGVPFNEVVATIKEWARPPRPDTLAITLPYHEVVRLANNVTGTIGRVCSEAIAPYEGDTP